VADLAVGARYHIISFTSLQEQGPQGWPNVSYLDRSGSSGGSEDPSGLISGIKWPFLGQNVIFKVIIIFNNNNLNYINIITIIALRIALLELFIAL